MAGITMHTLPRNEPEWWIAARKYKSANPLETSIHDAEYVKASGSKLINPECVDIHVLWPHEKRPKFGTDRHVDKIVPQNCFSQSRTHLEGDERFAAYIECIRNFPKSVSSSDSKKLGIFAHVLESQIYTRGLQGEDENDKLDLSPIANRTRARLAQASQLRPQTPSTPTPLRRQQELVQPLHHMDIDVEMNDDILSSPMSITYGGSPVTGEEAKQASVIKNEQEVVICLSILIRALRLVTDSVQTARYAAEQAIFTVVDKENEKVYSAKVDGVVRIYPRGKIWVISETKKGPRYRGNLSGAEIKAQESSEMAAWIAEVPPSNLEEMREKNLLDRYVMPYIHGEKTGVTRITDFP